MTSGYYYLCGDVNGDNSVNSLDITYLIDYLFAGGPPPVIYDAADVNGDSHINVLDIVYLVDYVYKGGPPPQCGY